MKFRAVIVVAALVAGLAGQGSAQTTSALNTEASRMDTLATGQGDGKVVDKISGDFSSFLGSDSKAVVTGLRYGTPIKLTTTTTTGSTPITPPPTSTTPGTTTPPVTTTTTVINPPTGKMGFGNVYISLALAKQQLGQMGITQPTPEQLKAALMGGTITTGTGTGTTTGTGTATGTTMTKTELPGILTMRSQNMGWGQIAHKLGFKLGPVVSAMKHSNQSMTVASSSSQGSGVVSGSGQSTGSTESGIVSSGGKPHGNSGHGASGKSGSGQGIVSGSGKSVGGAGHAYGHNKGGIVTGSGQVAGTSAGGHGNSQAKGHNK